ncbi:hypothetical protein M0802_006356 [Mischocyttarus mexicanus]|nr:hypothetical protein M0802_006356 [Mischocyttarus mexicanus]
MTRTTTNGGGGGDGGGGYGTSRGKSLHSCLRQKQARSTGVKGVGRERREEVRVGVGVGVGGGGGKGGELRIPLRKIYGLRGGNVSGGGDVDGGGGACKAKEKRAREIDEGKRLSKASRNLANTCQELETSCTE